MNPKQDIHEKLRARMQKGAAEFLEPDETVACGVTNLGLPAWLYGAFVGLLILPYVIHKACFAVITDRHVFVLKTNGLSFKATRVLLKAPLGSIEASFGGGAFPGRYLLIGDQKVWLAVNRKVHARARVIAAAASGQQAMAQSGELSASTAVPAAIS
jgi:hypothetical protein